MSQTSSAESVYITTPIYYVNDRPHIGHCYTTLLADGTARFHRLFAAPGSRTFFLTGTDEHADKVVTSAAARGKTPQEWADWNAGEFEKAFAFIGTTQDDFIRTTQDRHKTKVIEYIRALQKSGDIYLGSYEGWYDPAQEEYLTETAAKEADFKSPVTGAALVRRTEKCYFFKLSRYEAELRTLLEQDPMRVQPDARRNEVLGRLRDGLMDVPVSRPVTDDPATQWGIRMPEDHAHRIYVWIDALFNYLSVVDTDDRRDLWPPTVHFIAKDILWFHAVIWPAMLLALKNADPKRFGFVQLPKKLYSHAYWVRDGRKMSKSLNNFVTIEVLMAYAQKYSLDAVRWYLLTQGPQYANDADFSHTKFVEVFNADLANGLGNSLSRVGNMIEKYFAGVVPNPNGRFKFMKPREDLTPGLGTFPIDDPPLTMNVWDFPADCAAAVASARSTLAQCDIVSTLLQSIAIVNRVDGFINATQPFKIAKKLESAEVSDADKQIAREQLGAILYNCAEALRIASILASPALINKMPALWKTWNCAPPAGVPLDVLTQFAGPHAIKPGATIMKGEILFMRADIKEAAPTA